LDSTSPIGISMATVAPSRRVGGPMPERRRLAQNIGIALGRLRVPAAIIGRDKGSAECLRA
jgi:hypothetical protein